MCFGPFKRKKIKPEDLRRPGGMKVGITAFGLPKRYKILEGISEFQSFIENNSKLKIDIWFVQESNLPAGEIPPYKNMGCYMVTPDSLSSDSKGRMPSGMKTDIVVYDTQLREKCFGGLTWGFRKPPFISVPYNNDAGWDPGWKTSLAPGPGQAQPTPVGLASHQTQPETIISHCQTAKSTPNSWPVKQPIMPIMYFQRPAFIQTCL